MSQKGQMDLPGVNPANEPDKRSHERGRIPMSVPLQKLEVPQLAGYHLHWMLGTQARIAQALRAGYEFVEDDEIELNEFGVGTLEGNSDMGSRVSVVGGTDPTATGGENTLVLMKIKLEYYKEDQRALEDRNEKIARALRGAEATGQGDEDELGTRYVPKGHRGSMAKLFQRKR